MDVDWNSLDRTAVMRLWVVLLSLTVGCADPLAWLYRQDPEPYDPPPIYREYWAIVEDCTGIQGRFERLQFYVTDELPCPYSPGGCRGLWVEPHNIYLIRHSVNTENMVRHEMTHDLLRGGGHPPEYFPRCEGVE